MLGFSYRKTQVFLNDVPDWLARIALSRAPDHNTRWRAFSKLLTPARVRQALDRLVCESSSVNADLATKPLSVDSTCYDDHYRSSHYDRVCRRIKCGRAEKGRKSRSSWSAKANASRSRAVKTMPKLMLAVAAASHCI